MRHFIYRVLVAVVAVVLLPLTPMMANQKAADSNKTDDSEIVRLSADVIVDHDYFARGPVVEISGTVNGDVYAAGGQILIEGTINGDVLAAGGTVTIAGVVAQDVRVAGGEVTIDGEVGRNVTIAGGTIQLTKAATVQGGLVVAGGKVRISAPIGRATRIAGGTVTISDRISGDLLAAVGSLRLTSAAAVAGDLTYWSDESASIDPHAQIGGQVLRKTLPDDLRPSPQDLLGALLGVRLALWLTSLVSTLVLGFLLLRFYPNATRNAVDRLRAQPMASLGLGVLAFVLIPILAALAAVTVVGLPLALILVAWYVIALYLGRIFVIQGIGQVLLTRLGKQTGGRRAFLVGLAVYFVFALIPFLGGLITALTLMFGLGATLSMKKAIYDAAREQSMI